MSKLPKVGDTVMVRHRTKVNKAGVASIENATQTIDRVKRVMLDGDVVVTSGDLWKIKKSPDSKAVWATTGLEGR